MEINKEIRSKEKEVNAYIEELEAWILNLKASKFFELVMACDDASGKIAEDIRVLANSDIADEDVDAKLLMLGSNGNKRYERFLATVKQLKDFKLVDELLQDLKPKVALKEVKKNGKVEQEIEVVKPIPRMQDFVMNKKNADK